MKTHLSDGLYLVRHPNFTAGFVVEEGNIVSCAPILRRNLVYWQAWAVKIEEGEEVDPQERV